MLTAPRVAHPSRRDCEMLDAAGASMFLYGLRSLHQRDIEIEDAVVGAPGWGLIDDVPALVLQLEEAMKDLAAVENARQTSEVPATVLARAGGTVKDGQ